MVRKKEKFKGSLRLDWINKDKSLYYEIDEKENRGIKPQWVDKNDIRVSEPRILNFVKNYGDEENDNILIRGDNLLALRTLVEQFKTRDEEDKVKCIYIDPPFNTGNAFDKYDDNLKHSEWLTMMRDRLILLKKLLRKDGMIFVHIDNNEVAYLKVLMDEIFGRENSIQIISVKRASPAGFKTINPGPVTVTDFILIYSINRRAFLDSFKPTYLEVDYDSNYDLYIENFNEKPEEWRFKKIYEIVYEKEGINNWKEAKTKWGKNWMMVRDSLAGDFAVENAERVVSVRDPHKPSIKIKEYLTKSKQKKNKVFVMVRKDKNSIYFLNGGALSFYKNKLKVVDGNEVPTELLTDVWTDTKFSGIAKEGDVKFKMSKKPEVLIKRVLEMSTEKKDLVLDSFAGSGTTGAVAHKMGRRWIMVELGRHAEDLCIKRLQNVIKGDTTGISKIVNWKGGGGFKYYKLGESLISEDRTDVNWKLTYKQIAEALFYAKNFKLIDNKKLEKKNIFIGKNLNEKGTFAVCSVSKDLDTIGINDYEEFVKEIKEQGDFKEINLYTNKALAVREKNQLKEVVVRKIPQTILKKYNLI